MPVPERLSRFCRAYTSAIFTYERMRIFMRAGLAGNAFNRRYLDHVAKSMLAPMAEEITAAEGRHHATTEHMWNLHGGTVFRGTPGVI